MAKIKWKGGALLSPVPAALVTCSDGDEDNVFTVAWTGIVCSDPPKTYISVRPRRHSYGMIKNSREFAINLTTRDMAKATDACGVYTGAKMDKFERCRLSKEEATEINCPIIAESPLVLECRVCDVIPLGTHDMFLADIVAVDVDERLVDEKGKLHLDRAGLIAYAHGDYYELGRKLGGFGFSVAKKRTQKGKKK